MKPKQKSNTDAISDRLVKIGQSIANKLSHHINPLATPAKKRGLLVIGTSIATACVLLILHALQSNTPASEIHLERITTPADGYPGITTETDTRSQFNRMIRFKELIDKFSSAKDSTAIDSLMNAHPGLSDTLRMVIETYYPHTSP